MLKLSKPFSSSKDILFSLRALVAKFSKNNYQGEKLFLLLLNLLKQHDPHGRDPLELAEFSIINLKPLFGLRTKKVAGVKYKIPKPLTERQQLQVALSFLAKTLDQQKNTKDVITLLSSELLAASVGQGGAFRAKLALYAQIEESRSFLRFLRK